MKTIRFLLLIIAILIFGIVYLIYSSILTPMNSIDYSPTSSSEIVFNDRAEPAIFNDKGDYVKLEEIMSVESEELNYIAKEAELEAMLFDEVYYTDFNQTESFLAEYGFLQDLSEEDKCKRVLELMERAKCPKNKRKFFKQIVKKVQLGGFKVQNKFPFIIFPGWSKYSDEVNRLNLIMEYYYRNQQRYCHIVQQCELAKYTVYCNALSGRETPEIITNEYKKCIDIILNDRTEDLVKILSEMGTTLDKIRSTEIDSVVGKEALKNDVNDLEALKDKQEKELDDAENEDGNTTEQDSTQQDTSKVTNDTIEVQKDTISTEKNE